MHKCAAIIVTYFPDDTSIDNINKISGACDKIIVIDNTPKEVTTVFPNKNNIMVVKFPANVGLASALNQGLKTAKEEGIENVFLFDQDSRPPNYFFRKMLSFKSNIDEMDSKCAFYVPNFYDRNSKTFARFPLLTRYTLRHATCRDIQSLQANRALIAITSGMLITCSRYEEIGPFRDDYFIDFIDNEYCLKANKKGFSIAVNCNVVLNHAIGKRFTYRFYGITIKPNNHPPVRRYYISRNGIRTAIDFIFDYPSYFPLIVARIFHELISILLYEKNKFKKIKAVFYGIYHGLIGQMGKCQIRSLISSKRQT